MFGLIGSGLSAIGNAARSLFSGRHKARRAALKAAQDEAKAAKLQLQTTQKRIEAQKTIAATQMATAQARKGKLLNLVESYWWVAAIGLGAYLFLPQLLGKKKKVGRRPAHRKTVAKRKPVSRSRGRKKSSGSDFAEKMRRARNKKRKERGLPPIKKS